MGSYDHLKKFFGITAHAGKNFMSDFEPFKTGLRDAAKAVREA